jgi:hypothetical protein
VVCPHCNVKFEVEVAPLGTAPSNTMEPEE